jgi:hypothetical protein
MSVPGGPHQCRSPTTCGGPSDVVEVVLRARRRGMQLAEGSPTDQLGDRDRQTDEHYPRRPQQGVGHRRGVITSGVGEHDGEHAHKNRGADRPADPLAGL